MVDTGGTYDMASQQNYDGYLHLYQDNFDPNSPCTNYLNGDNDGITLNRSELDHSLEAGRVYYLITSGNLASNAGNFSNTITGPGTVNSFDSLFTLDDANPDDSDGVNNSITFSNLPLGTHTIVEYMPDAWSLSGAVCTGGSGTVSLTDETLSVEVGNGETVQCTFTNEHLCPTSWTVATAAELSACITLANTNESPSPTADTITLGADITLSTALPQITSEITLEGAGYAVDGGDSVQLFNVNLGDFTVNRAMLQNGSATTGGGIYNDRGTGRDGGQQHLLRQQCHLRGRHLQHQSTR